MNTNSLRDQLLRSLATGVEYRHAFVEEKIRTGLAVQIRAIRELRKMNQTVFAQRLGKSQSWVSRLEDPNQAIPTIPTLLILARAFDVDLDVRFVPFSEMLDRLSRLTPEAHEVPRFEDDRLQIEQLPRSVTYQTAVEASGPSAVSIQTEELVVTGNVVRFRPKAEIDSQSATISGNQVVLERNCQAHG